MTYSLKFFNYFVKVLYSEQGRGYNDVPLSTKDSHVDIIPDDTGSDNKE